MHPRFSLERRRRRPTLALALALAFGAVAVGPVVSMEATEPTTAGQHVISTFTGGVKGIVHLTDMGGGATRVRITLRGAPHGTMRLVGSTAPCSTALGPGNRAFSLTYQKIEWVRATTSGLMEDEGIWFLRSLRLVRPGSPPKQIACRAAVPYLDADPVTAAITLENTLISSYSVVSGTRGMIVANAASEDTVRVRAVLQRTDAGVTYRLVGSTAPCGSPNNPAATVFSAKLDPGDTVNGISEANALWQLIESIRVVRGGSQETCLQGQLEVVNGLN